MDQKLPIVAKKYWKIVRVAYFMLRKGLSSKRKLMFDLNLLMKRGKIASKAAFQNLMFQGHNNNEGHQSTSKDYYEFSCSNTPAFHLPFNLNKRINNKHNHHAVPAIENDDVVMMNTAVLKALEMLDENEITGSPALPGFGRTPIVRQLRITDSPFPITDPADIISHVDEKADEFISRFYRDLRREAASAFA